MSAEKGQFPLGGAAEMLFITKKITAPTITINGLYTQIAAFEDPDQEAWKLIRGTLYGKER